MNQSLEQLLENNKSVHITEEDDHYKIEDLWNDSTFIILCKKDDDLSPLSNIKLPTELSAIFHTTSNKLEFIFAPLPENEYFLGRTVKYIYQGEEFSTHFGTPSEALKLMASGFREIEDASTSSYRNLPRFRDYYRQESMPRYIKEYFEDKTPISFFISGDFKKIDNNYSALSKTVNFYSTYYDRKAPAIVIFEKEESQEEFHKPCYLEKQGFPEIINTNQIDPIILDMFRFADDTSNIRLKYIFYFQILEYCSYYHLNSDIKHKLSNILKQPDLNANSNQYARSIIEEFKDHFRVNNDSQKLEKIITETVAFSDLKSEFEKNIEFFCNDLKFEGGFTIKGLFHSKECLDKAPKNIMQSVANNIEKIRNVLVHLRESRENKVILPTRRNNNLIRPYLYLVHRLAEKVAIQFE